MPTAKLSPKPNQVPALLNRSLAGMIDLRLQTKQAHWNVKGPQFIALHELFDKIYNEVGEYVDMLAERTVQLGTPAQGSLKEVSAQTALPMYPTGFQDGMKHVKALGAAISAMAEQTRAAIDSSDDLGDAVTADLFTGIARGLDKLRWMVESHRE